MAGHGGGHDMPATSGTAPGTGLSTSADGFTFDSSVARLEAGSNQAYRFRMLGPSGTPVTSFVPDQTKLMHFYAIRSDLTGYQHLHPTLESGGTWSTELRLDSPGPYRVFTSFIARDEGGQQHSLVLSRELTVPGAYQAAALPPPSDSTEVDGYRLSVKGQLQAGRSAPLQVNVTRGGQPVTDLEPYLDTFAHLTAFRSGDLAFAHLHPEGSAAAGRKGGPDLSFHAQVPEAGDYRLFLQFQTAGQLHTAAVTLRVA